MFRSLTTRRREYQCYWDYVPGPRRLGETPRTRVFICEYPYRTMRTTGPCEDCTTCGTKTESAPAHASVSWINWIADTRKTG